MRAFDQVFEALARFFVRFGTDKAGFERLQAWRTTDVDDGLERAEAVGVEGLIQGVDVPPRFEFDLHADGHCVAGAGLSRLDVDFPGSSAFFLIFAADEVFIAQIGGGGSFGGGGGCGRVCCSGSGVGGEGDRKGVRLGQAAVVFVAHLVFDLTTEGNSGGIDALVQLEVACPGDVFEILFDGGESVQAGLFDDFGEVVSLERGGERGQTFGACEGDLGLSTALAGGRVDVMIGRDFAVTWSWTSSAAVPGTNWTCQVTGSPSAVDFFNPSRSWNPWAWAGPHHKETSSSGRETWPAFGGETEDEA